MYPLALYCESTSREMGLFLLLFSRNLGANYCRNRYEGEV
jgi:hypothetical protein